MNNQVFSLDAEDIHTICAMSGQKFNYNTSMKIACQYGAWSSDLVDMSIEIMEAMTNEV